jgi:hypothetical protein
MGELQGAYAGFTWNKRAVRRARLIIGFALMAGG